MMPATTREPVEPDGLVHTLRATATVRLRRARFRSRHLRRPVVALRHRGLRPDDAFCVSYPRSGSTWTLFMLCEVLTGEPTTFGELHRTIPYLGGHDCAPGVLSGGGRLVHSHEVGDLGDRRVVYLVRDPRSVVLSEYRWQLMAGLFEGPFPAFLDDFLAGTSNPWSSWADHVHRWFAHGRRASDRLLVVRYEELRQAPAAHLQRILGFLGEPAPPSRVEPAVAANDLAAMRDKERRSIPAKHRGDLDFVGQGSIGLWREALTPDQAAAIAERFAPAMRLAGYEP